MQLLQLLSHCEDHFIHLVLWFYLHQSHVKPLHIYLKLLIYLNIFINTKMSLNLIFVGRRCNASKTDEHGAGHCSRAPVPNRYEICSQVRFLTCLIGNAHAHYYEQLGHVKTVKRF